MKDELKQAISKVSEELKSVVKNKEELIQLAVFDLDVEEYAVPITDIREIIKIPNITPIPGVPEFIPGILNLRGKIVVVVDLEKRFNLIREHPIETQHIVVTEVGENTFGILVDKVTEVLRVPLGSISPTPALVSSKIHNDYLSGVIVLENKKADKEKESRLLILLDLPKLLREKELLQMGEVIQEVTNNKS